MVCQADGDFEQIVKCGGQYEEVPYTDSGSGFVYQSGWA